jgi:hypothetical protein
MYYGTGACFLQDADNLILPTKDLVEILTFLRNKFPEVLRVTTYSRSRTVIRKSVEALKQIRQAGLDRVHIGLETGYTPLLKLMKKGVSADQQIEAGKKIVAAGMELSEYVMPGLGGQALWKEHAAATADVLNQINPHFIRLRSLRIPKRVPLYTMLADGSFKMQTDDMLAEEIRHFVEALDGIDSTITSDHIMNLLEGVSGKLPEDKAKMLAVIAKYQDLSDLDRLIYRVGRRGGIYRSTDDLQSDPVTYAKIKTLLKDVENEDGAAGVERFIASLMKFNPGADEAAIEDLEQSLDQLPNVIKEILVYEIGRDVVRSERSYDFAIVSLFANIETLDRYRTHPEHLKVLEKIKNLCADIVVVDFEGTDASSLKEPTPPSDLPEW